MEDIGRKAVEYFLRKGIEAQRIPESELNSSTDKVLTNLELIDYKGFFKNVAILLFGKNPLKFSQASGLRLTVLEKMNST